MYQNNQEAHIVLFDEVNCYIGGLHPDHYLLLKEKYSFPIQNAQFDPKYQVGAWDGKKVFFTEKGKTYTYLLKDILIDVKSMGYKLNLIDKRKYKHLIPFQKIDENYLTEIVIDGKNWKYRDYQIESLNKLFENNGGILIAGTGAGKTSICAGIIKYYEKYENNKSITVVPSVSLVEQTANTFKKFGIDVGVYYGNKKELEKQHLVSTWQSLKNNPKIVSLYNVLIVDECHGVRGNVLHKLLTNEGGNIPYRFAVTGTMPKDYTEKLMVHTGIGKDVVYEVEPHYLIEKGYLSKLDIHVFDFKIDLRNEYKEYLKEENAEKVSYEMFKKSYLPSFQSERAFLTRNEKRTKWIVDFIERIRLTDEKHNTLILVPTINFGKKLEKEIDGSVFLSGSVDVKDREKTYNLFSEHDDVICIATYNIASTGIDIPRIFNLMCVDAGKSFIKVVQSIGRGLRKAEDKNYISVFDITTSDLYYQNKHKLERLKIYQEMKYPHIIHKIEL